MIIFINFYLYLGSPKSSRPGALGPKITGTETMFTWSIDGESARKKESSGLVSEYKVFFILLKNLLDQIEYRNGEMSMNKMSRFLLLLLSNHLDMSTNHRE